MKKKDETLQPTIIAIAQDTINNYSVDALNIRNIAKEANVSVGTIYNYFANKDEILLALTQKFWLEILTNLKSNIKSDNFVAQLGDIYQYLYQSMSQDGLLLMRSLSNIEDEGRQAMSKVQQYLGQCILELIVADQNIKKDLFDQQFSQEKFVEFIINNFVERLKSKADNIDFFQGLISKLIYK